MHLLIILNIEEQTFDPQIEEYTYYQEADEESLYFYKQYFFDYINSEIIHNSILCVLNSLRKQISDIIINQIKLIPTSKEMIRYLIAKSKANKLQLEDSLTCCYFIKGNRKSRRKNKTLKHSHHLSEKSYEIYHEVYSFIIKMLQKYSIKTIEKSIILNTFLEEKLLKEKIVKIFISGIYDNLFKENIEKYLSSFLIDKIMLKQKKKMEIQEKKLKEMEVIKIENECIICMDKQRNILFLPCNHLICCDKCSDKFIYKNECPGCKRKIENKINIY